MPGWALSRAAPPLFWTPSHVERSGPVRGGAFQELLGATHAEVIIENQGECSVDNILEHLSRVIASDRMGDFSIGRMKVRVPATPASLLSCGLCVHDTLVRLCFRMR